MGPELLPQLPIYPPEMNLDTTLPGLQLPVRAPTRTNPTSRKQSSI